MFEYPISDGFELNDETRVLTWRWKMVPVAKSEILIGLEASVANVKEALRTVGVLFTSGFCDIQGKDCEARIRLDLDLDSHLNYLELATDIKNKLLKVQDYYILMSAKSTMRNMRSKIRNTFGDVLLRINDISVAIDKQHLIEGIDKEAILAIKTDIDKLLSEF